ncbi:TMEM222 [Mytilus edulis]|uniref:TMEM222 n=1 Tax=Mytilus edulis TaxID=6550 RepID=A0A8S3V7M7_MYTED|nr:TMEM222 [Mytilus edulis]
MYNHQDGTTCENAIATCKKEPPGANIAMPKTKNQRNYMVNSYAYLTSFWIGLQDSNADQNWTWLDDSKLTNWTPNNKNDSGLFQSGFLNAGCAGITFEEKITWRAIPCSLETGVLCQVDALDIPWPDENSDRACKCEDKEVLTNITSTTIEVIVEELKVDKSTLSSYLRTKTSAPDSRGSSRFLGTIGIVLITLIFGFIVALDFTPPRRFKVKFFRKCSIPVMAETKTIENQEKTAINMPGHLPLYGDKKIDTEKQRYPHCIVWTPLPCITWLFPIIGHMGICTSAGVIRDFAGPYFVSEDDMAFGNPVKYWQLDLGKVNNGKEAWDRGVMDSCEEYKHRMHNLFCDNCHSHVAMALNTMKYNGKTSFNMVNLCFYMLLYGKYTK